ncbi:cytochrome c [Metapseudomonas lalkuanensis]|uniref:Cytochrome c n=1 Tax=Metapseudomonas lalkuanensis TaxID=2604832 RepID=A0A5J6QKX5_9GAMM|nr:cytochrome c [Pseudomonas lalkuanensis]
MKKTIKILALTGLVVAAGVGGVVYSGVVNVAADDPHYSLVHSFLTAARDRSIEVRSRGIQVPPLDGAELIRAGAGNYDAMCVGCHLAPGVEATELSQALYPAPPNLARQGVDGDPAATFWVIKHGIKATGMAAWGKSMGDEHIWGMVAFLQQLPKLDAAGYRQLVASSDGHQHGGGESTPHGHESELAEDEGHGHDEGHVH